MNQNKPSNTLAVIGLVLGVIAIIFSFIPCVGTLAFLPGIVGVILGVIAYLKAKDNGYPKGMPIAVISVSAIAFLIAVFQIFFIGNFASNAKTEMKEYTNCEDLIKDYNQVQEEIKTLTNDIENDKASFSSIASMAKLTVKLGSMQEQSEKLGCNIDIESDMESFEDLGSKAEASEEAVENASEEAMDATETDSSGENK